MVKCKRRGAERRQNGTLVGTLRSVCQVFTGQLGLERRGGALHVVIKPAANVNVAAPEPPAAPVDPGVSLMRGELKALLDGHPMARQVLPALAELERLLGAYGEQALAAMQPPVLGRSSEELESIVKDWSPAGLATLRARMLDMLKVREDETQGDEEASFRVASQPEVAEGAVTHSDFIELNRIYQTANEDASSRPCAGADDETAMRSSNPS